MLAWQGASLLVAGETWNLASFLNLTSENALSPVTQTLTEPSLDAGQTGVGALGSSAEPSWGHTPAWRAGVPPPRRVLAFKAVFPTKGERSRSPMRRGWMVSLRRPNSLKLKEKVCCWK